MTTLATTVDLVAYRESPSERARVNDLMALVPPGLTTALDIGARDGHLSRLLAERCGAVTALDLERPNFTHPGVTCVKGDLTALEHDFDRHAFDLSLCAEVLEHIPRLAEACTQLAHVTAKFIIIGVPYRQDIRFGRTTCSHCGAKNPPWGHVNSFDEHRIASLFPGFAIERLTFVGSKRERTNALATALMDYAGNPYGTYAQQEPCVECGRSVGQPAARSLAQKVATKAAYHLQKAQEHFIRPHGNWMHVLLKRR